MQFERYEIHIWHQDLALSSAEEKEKTQLLSLDEKARASRFRFPIHRRRFIAARSFLREILGLYLNISPAEVHFSYNEHRKPAISHPTLHFNLAHSNDIAVVALTQQFDIGVDIEKLQDDYKENLAKRFFNAKEYAALMNLPAQERISGFFRLWSRKEALIKAIGKGLNIPLSSFAVSLQDRETISFDNISWTLLSITIDPQYQSAVASNQPIEKISYWRFFNQTPQLERVSSR